jgi:hypothetical protein
MLLIIFLALFAKLTFVSGDCNFGPTEIVDFDWTKVGVRLLTGIVKEAAVETLFLFPLTKHQYSISE